MSIDTQLIDLGGELRSPTSPRWQLNEKSGSQSYLTQSGAYVDHQRRVVQGTSAIGSGSIEGVTNSYRIRGDNYAKDIRSVQVEMNQRGGTLELTRPRSGNLGGLHIEELVDIDPKASVRTSKISRNVSVTSNTSTATAELKRGVRNSRTSLSSLQESMKSLQGPLDSPKTARRDSLSSMSSLESMNLGRARHVFAENKSYERMREWSAIDEADDVDVDYTTVTIAACRLVPVWRKRLYELPEIAARQSFEHIRDTFLARGRLFKDPLFKAGESNLAWEDAQTHTENIGWWSKKNQVVWMRPHKICEVRGISRDRSLAGGSSRFDFIQGEINDSWLLAALVSLAENKNALKKVIPKGQKFSKGYAGVFRFRFWRLGEWQEIVIDDRLPTRHGQLIYLKSKEENEFWCSLIEKAYAKWYGSYQMLTCGLACEAAVDFTGGIPEMIDLTTTTMSPQKIFHLMRAAHERGAFMACCIKDNQLGVAAQKDGLQTVISYAITKVVEIRAKHIDLGIPLVKLRNPNGNNKEWRGDWADGDPKWASIPEAVRRQLNLVFSDDGEFYMGFRDFLKYFSQLEICHLVPDEDDSRAERALLQTFRDQWRAGVSAGGSGVDGIERFATNPQFFVDLKDSDPFDDEDQCNVIISLAQKQEYGKRYYPIGFKVYACPMVTRSSQNRLSEHFLRTHSPIARSGPFIDYREVSARLLLPPGRYCIVPSTYKSGMTREFSLRVLQERDFAILSRQPVIQQSENSSDRSEVVTVTFTRSSSSSGGLLNMYKWSDDGIGEQTILSRMFKAFG